MPSKTQEYLKLANRTANGITRYWEHWTDFLTTASRLYKYSFTDQLMIYAQRPDATACASFDIWNNRMNRYVRRGSKGIALLDQSSSVPRLHYVFDVSDTGVRRNSRDPEVWQLNDDLFQQSASCTPSWNGAVLNRRAILTGMIFRQFMISRPRMQSMYWVRQSAIAAEMCCGISSAPSKPPSAAAM